MNNKTAIPECLTLYVTLKSKQINPNYLQKFRKINLAEKRSKYHHQSHLKGKMLKFLNILRIPPKI